MKSKTKTLIACGLATICFAFAQDPPSVSGPITPPTLGSVALVWDPTPPPDSARVKGYKMYVRQDGILLSTIDSGLTTTLTIPSLPLGKTYAFTVTAYDEYGIESTETEPLIVPLGVPVSPPSNLRVVEIQISHDLKEWRSLAFIPVSDEDMPLFVRGKTTTIDKAPE